MLDVWVRNQNSRLRTLAMASDLQIDLLPGDCIQSRNHQLAKLVKDSRATSSSRPTYYFTLTVAGGGDPPHPGGQDLQRLLSRPRGVLPRQLVEPGVAWLHRLEAVLRVR